MGRRIASVHDRRALHPRRKPPKARAQIDAPSLRTPRVGSHSRAYTNNTRPCSCWHGHSSDKNPPRLQSVRHSISQSIRIFTTPVDPSWQHSILVDSFGRGYGSRLCRAATRRSTGSVLGFSSPLHYCRGSVTRTFAQRLKPSRESHRAGLETTQLRP